MVSVLFYKVLKINHKCIIGAFLNPILWLGVKKFAVTMKMLTRAAKKILPPTKTFLCPEFAPPPFQFSLPPPLPQNCGPNRRCSTEKIPRESATDGCSSAR